MKKVVYDEEKTKGVYLINTLINTIIEYKWAILLSCEITAWLFLGLMIYFRYFIKSKSLFWTSTIISGVLGYVPHLSIPILIAFKEQSVTAIVENKGDFLFVLFIVCLLILGFTLGKKYITSFDRYMYKLAEKRQLQS